MSATGYEFRCPKCGERRHFAASQINIVSFGVEIDTEWGWDYHGRCSESEIDENAELKCGRCGYEAHRGEFEAPSAAAPAKLEVPCPLGTLVAERSGDPGVFDEIEIDLVRPDGMLMQLAVVGTEAPADDGKPVDLHVYAWDGSDESPTHEVHPDTANAVWYGI